MNQPGTNVYLKALAMALPAFLAGFMLPTVVRLASSPSVQHGSDLRAFYSAGQMIANGEGPKLYDQNRVREVQAAAMGNDGMTSPFLHLAYEAILFVPLAGLHFRAAYVLWCVLNLAILGVIIWLLYPQLANLRSVVHWLPAALILFYFPVSFAIINGQDSLILLLIVVLAYLKLIKQGQFFAGVILGLGLFRYQFIVLMILLFAMWHGWRLLKGFALSAISACALSVAVVGLRAQREYFILLRSVADSANQPVVRMVNLRGLWHAMFGISHLTLALTVITSGLLMVIAYQCGKRLTPANQFLLAVLASCMVSYHMFPHDLSLLLLPLVMTMNLCVEQSAYRWLAILAAVFALPELIALFLSPSNFHWLALATAVAFAGFLRLSRQYHCERTLPLVGTENPKLQMVTTKFVAVAPKSAVSV